LTSCQSKEAIGGKQIELLINIAEGRREIVGSPGGKGGGKE